MVEHPLAHILGRLTPDLAESYAWLTSPAAISGEIARLEAAARAGDTSPTTHSLLADWRAIRQAQRALVLAQEGGE